MRLKNFKPAGRNLVAKVTLYHSSESGLIHKMEPEKDMFAEVVAVGDECEKAKVGDLVMFGQVPLLVLPFDTPDGEIECVMGTEFQVLAYYNREPDETRIFVPETPSKNALPNNEGIQVMGDGPMGSWGGENQDLMN